MKSIFLVLAVILASGWVIPLKTSAQINLPSEATQPSSADLHFLTRAKNLARQAGINNNGGLQFYRPEASMYGPALESPHQNNPDGSVTFTFLGKAPGSEVYDKETVATVAPDGSVSLVYNGAVRESLDGDGTPKPKTTNSDKTSALALLDEATFLARAQNLARQLGIKENGGLSKYRPEAAMFGPSSQSPMVKNSDGSVTFTFKGGDPFSQTPTQETEVLVTRDGQVSLIYNGAIR